MAKDSLAKASTPEPFSTSKTSNWVARGGGLPPYIQHVAHDLMEEHGKTESQAIQMAIGIVKNWAAGKGKVDENTRAAAKKAVAEWEALKAKAHAKVDASAVIDEDAFASALVAARLNLGVTITIRNDRWDDPTIDDAQVLRALAGMNHGDRVELPLGVCVQRIDDGAETLYLIVKGYDAVPVIKRSLADALTEAKAEIALRKAQEDAERAKYAGKDVAAYSQVDWSAPVDEGVLALALSEARRGSELLLAIEFDPKKHPRDLHGHFRDVVGKLKPGESVKMPDGTTVSHEDDHYNVHSADHFKSSKMASADAATTKAIAYSGASQNPKSVGGAKSHASADRALEAHEKQAKIEQQANQDYTSAADYELVDGDHEMDRNGLRLGKDQDGEPLAAFPDDTVVLKDGSTATMVRGVSHRGGQTVWIEQDGKERVADDGEIIGVEGEDGERYLKQGAVSKGDKPGDGDLPGGFSVNDRAHFKDNPDAKVTIAGEAGHMPGHLTVHRDGDNTGTPMTANPDHLVKESAESGKSGKAADAKGDGPDAEHNGTKAPRRGSVAHRTQIVDQHVSKVEALRDGESLKVGPHAGIKRSHGAYHVESTAPDTYPSTVAADARTALHGALQAHVKGGGKLDDAKIEDHAPEGGRVKSKRFGTHGTVEKREGDRAHVKYDDGTRSSTHVKNLDKSDEPAPGSPEAQDKQAEAEKWDGGSGFTSRDQAVEGISEWFQNEIDAMAEAADHTIADGSTGSARASSERHGGDVGAQNAAADDFGGELQSYLPEAGQIAVDNLELPDGYKPTENGIELPDGTKITITPDGTVDVEEPGDETKDEPVDGVSPETWAKLTQDEKDAFRRIKGASGKQKPVTPFTMGKPSGGMRGSPRAG